MIIKRIWDSKKGIKTALSFRSKYTYTGWFLFGIIPIYISRQLNY